MGSKESFLYNTDPAFLILILFMGMITLMRLGSYFGSALLKNTDGNENTATSTVLAALFGLFAFLLAFTFSMSGTRYDARRTSTIQEANAIGTAIMRTDLYPDSTRNLFRMDFKRYTAARISYHGQGHDRAAMDLASKESQRYGSLIWNRATTLAKNSVTLYPGNMMIPALNEMFDSATANDFAEKMRVPDTIVIMLFALALLCAFFVGYHSSNKGRFDWVIATGFCVLTALVIYITLDLDRPRVGFIRLNTSHQALSDLLKLFDKP